MLPENYSHECQEAEEAFLGGLISVQDFYWKIEEKVRHPEVMFNSDHQKIFESIQEIKESGKNIDIVILNEHLRQRGELENIGGPVRLVDLQEKYNYSISPEQYSAIVWSYYVRRMVLKSGQKIVEEACIVITPSGELINDVQQELFKLSQMSFSGTYSTSMDVSLSFMKRLEMLSTRESGLVGIPSGFVELDRITNGWQSTDLITLAGRPGMGKTAFVIACARNAAIDFGKKVAIFSLEMSNEQLMERMTSLESDIPLTKIKDGKLEDYEWTQINPAVERISESGIFFDDTAGINVSEMAAKCRDIKLKHGLDLVIIDYIQLMGDTDTKKNTNREQEVSAISRGLKRLAKSIKAPVIALSQLSRAVEKRGGDKRPMLSDLRESGSIEQDSDIVGFLYRPEYYNILEDVDGVSLKGIAEVLIAKHRHGPLGTVRLRFDGDRTKFSDLDDSDFDSVSSQFPATPTPVLIDKPNRTNDDDDIPF